MSKSKDIIEFNRIDWEEMDDMEKEEAMYEEAMKLNDWKPSHFPLNRMINGRSDD